MTTLCMKATAGCFSYGSTLVLIVNVAWFLTSSRRIRFRGNVCKLCFALLTVYFLLHLLESYEAHEASQNIHFLTFATSDISLKEIRAEAEHFGFTAKFFYDEKYLKVTELWSKHGDFILENKRGFGYWIWKPFLVSDTLKRLKENDALLYADGGCALNSAGAERLLQYVDMARASNGLLLFHVPMSETLYSKIDTIRRILPTVPIEELGQQRIGTAFVVINTKETRRFFQHVLKIATEHSYHFLDDSPSTASETPDFIDHRHDQSIMSLLSKHYNYSSIPDETYPPEKAHRLGFPIIGARRKQRANADESG